MEVKEVQAMLPLVSFFPKNRTRPPTPIREVPEEVQEEPVRKKMFFSGFKKPAGFKLNIFKRKPDTKITKEKWGSRLTYLVAFLSFSLSLNNFYHFPLNIYKYVIKQFFCET